LSDPSFRSGTIADAVVRLRSGTSDPDGSDLVTIASTQQLVVGRCLCVHLEQPHSSDL
jgi:hypothetical protein